MNQYLRLCWQTLNEYFISGSVRMYKRQPSALLVIPCTLKYIIVVNLLYSLYSDKKETNERHRCIFQFNRKLHSHLLSIAVTVAVCIFSVKLSLSLSLSRFLFPSLFISYSCQEHLVSKYFICFELRVQHSIDVHMEWGVCTVHCAQCIMHSPKYAPCLAHGITFWQ